MGDMKKVQEAVGAADKVARQHLEGPALEKRLAKIEEDPPSAEACLSTQPEAEYPDIEGDLN